MVASLLDGLADVPFRRDQIPRLVLDLAHARQRQPLAPIVAQLISDLEGGPMTFERGLGRAAQQMDPTDVVERRGDARQIARHLEQLARHLEVHDGRPVLA